VAAFGLVVALAGAVLWFRQEPPPTDVAPENSTGASGSASPTPPPESIAAWRPGAPRSIRIERLGVRSPVSRVAIRDKGIVAREAERLFGQEVPGRLVLITCEDWDGTAYRSNVVVTAQPVAPPIDQPIARAE
jgi:hypothetical protein